MVAQSAELSRRADSQRRLLEINERLLATLDHAGVLETIADGLLSVVAIVLIVVFFVTSSDSGSFVVDMIATGGELAPPVWSRAFWAGLEGVVAAVLLVAGGLAALQTMAILVALPFSIVMVLMVFATTKALMAEHRVITRRREDALADRVAEKVDAAG